MPDTETSMSRPTAMVRSTATDMSSVLASVLPTRLAEAAFLYWDSLSPTVKEDYGAVKKRLQDVFGLDHSLTFFQTHVNARPRKPDESLEVYSADITRLVMEAFPDYGCVAQEGEQFRRFVAGLDPALQVKIHEMGATDLAEALVVAGRCERARAALNLQASYPPMQTKDQVSMTCPDAASDKLLKAIEQLTLKMNNLQSDVRQLQEENTYLSQRFDHWASHHFPSDHRDECQTRVYYSPDRRYGHTPEFHRGHHPDSPEVQQSRRDWISDDDRHHRHSPSRCSGNSQEDTRHHHAADNTSQDPFDWTVVIHREEHQCQNADSLPRRSEVPSPSDTTDSPPDVRLPSHVVTRPINENHSIPNYVCTTDYHPKPEPHQPVPKQSKGSSSPAFQLSTSALELQEKQEHDPIWQRS
ncbi:uncharacterized protein LOC109528270 [Hippocampus comes]|uniref:uncharacterized protein LOC109528270 n=1 Tax=Hippocampus comes TaxID=109280 RepID=UPI00094E9256|nr:PREDICTED: uncharacterized protein LOC109528270 [Hippocampus comes]